MSSCFVPTSTPLSGVSGTPKPELFLDFCGLSELAFGWWLSVLLPSAQKGLRGNFCLRTANQSVTTCLLSSFQNLPMPVVCPCPCSVLFVLISLCFLNLVHVILVGCLGSRGSHVQYSMFDQKFPNRALLCYSQGCLLNIETPEPFI